jgi:adenylate cyclase class 2
VSNKIEKDQEQEVKFLLSDPSALQTRLENSGAQLVQARVHEFNLRFDTPDHELSAGERVLRLRQDTEARLTYKGPSDLESGVNIRQEIEFRVDDFAAARRLFEALGYQVEFIYEKYRAVYSLGLDSLDLAVKSDGDEPGALLFTLDRLPFGDFAEIEGPGRAAIKAGAEQMVLNWQARILHSYAAMFKDLKSELKLEFRDLTFANFEQLDVKSFDLGAAPADAGF